MDRFVKALLDRVLALFLLALFSPIFFAIVGILMFQPGPIFFSQKRIGKGGVGVRIFKFRSMVVDSDSALKAHLESSPAAALEWKKYRKLKEDPRVTSVGKIIRRYSLDELPQLVNVLQGSMSLVGPRPVAEDELARYGPSKRYYLQVKPGITGIWQVTRTDETSYTRRVALDRVYVIKRTVCLDLRIMLLTGLRLIAPRGAY